MSYTKQNFKINDIVKFGQTSSELDGKSGIVMAKLEAYQTDDYIIGLDEPFNGNMAILISEACLSLAPYQK